MFVAIVFAVSVFAAYMFVMRKALARLKHLIENHEPVQSLIVTISLASLVMTALSVVGTFILESTTRTPNWSATFGWNCIVFLVTASSLVAVTTYQMNRIR